VSFDVKGRNVEVGAENRWGIAPHPSLQLLGAVVTSLRKPELISTWAHTLGVLCPGREKFLAPLLELTRARFTDLFPKYDDVRVSGDAGVLEPLTNRHLQAVVNDNLSAQLTKLCH